MRGCHRVGMRNEESLSILKHSLLKQHAVGRSSDAHVRTKTKNNTRQTPTPCFKLKETAMYSSLSMNHQDADHDKGGTVTQPQEKVTEKDDENEDREELETEEQTGNAPQTAGTSRDDCNSKTPNKNPNGRSKGRNPQRKRHGARNQHRHKGFVKWIIDTFTLGDNLHVLDVAGGKGEVSARLTMCHRQNVVMVDPRPADIVNCYETLVLPKIPNKWQRRLEEQRKENPNFVKEIVDERFQQLVTTFDDQSLAISEDLQDAVKEASVILGLHADGATEAIVNAALNHQKPFVVVPCCVFPNLFKKRRVEENGQMVPVRSHEQFCKYLANKDARFKIEVLPFDGRNVAIWWDGK